MRRVLIFGAAFALVAGAATTTFVVLHRSAPTRSCTTPQTHAVDPRRASDAEGPASIDRNHIVVTGGCDTYRSRRVRGGAAKYVARATGSLAYVNDRRGADLLQVFVHGKAVHAPTHGEVTGPAWSPDGNLAWVED